MATFLLPIAPVHGQSVEGKPTVKVVGPLAAKEMVDALAADFAKGASSPAVDFSRIEHSGAAGRALLGGRDMMLCLGKVSEKDLGYAADRWKALAPREHTIAAQAVAIVVQPRNAIESMTLKQLQAAFSGEARDWTVFGGRRNAIRRYGLAFTDPLSGLFHEKVLSADRKQIANADHWFDHDSKAILAERRRVVAESWDVLATLRKLIQERRDLLGQLHTHVAGKVSELEEQCSQAFDKACSAISRANRSYLKSEPVHGPGWVEEEAENDEAVIALREQIGPLQETLDRLATLYHRVGRGNALTFRQREVYEQLN